MSPEERAELLDALLDGTISDVDLLRIEAELSVDAQVRSEYHRRLQLETILRTQYSNVDSQDLSATLNSQAVASPSSLNETEWKQLGEPTNNSASPRLLPVLAGILIGIAACLPFVFLIRGSLRQAPPKTSPTANSNLPTSQEMATAEGFGILNGAANVTWNGSAVQVGDLLPTGPLHLSSGRIHLELFSGVQLMIEGDSKFSIDSPMQVTMLTGQARAYVPEPAQGFRLKTNTGEVVDLGTEFSVAIDDTGADVRVLEGEVELHATDQEPQRIQEGLALRLASAGITEASRQTSVSLPSPLEFQEVLEKQQASRLLIWQDSVEDLRADSRLLAYYQFAPRQIRSRMLKNLANERTHGASDGAIVAGRPSSDRWSRSDSAIDFSRTGSRVRVNVPGEHHGLTLYCWVKVNSLDRMYNSLFLTDGHEDFEPHWQILDDGRVFFSVKLPKAAGVPVRHRFMSPKIWETSLSGKWIMLGVTYDVDNQRVTHFLNGSPVSEEIIPNNALCETIRIGAASICNWSEPMYSTDPTFVVRNLNGSMDEFAIYSGALNEDEILELYEAGKPNEH